MKDGCDRIRVRRPIAFSFGSELPLGIRQKDCDGAPFQLADAGGTQLWAACSPAQQELLSARFVDAHAEALRDAILDLEDASVSARASPAKVRQTFLGDLLWSLWIGFRDRALREMRARGEFIGS